MENKDDQPLLYFHTHCGMMSDILALCCHASGHWACELVIYLNQMHHGSWDKTARFQKEILDNVTINASRDKCLYSRQDACLCALTVQPRTPHVCGYQDLYTIINMLLPINFTFLGGFTYHVIMVLPISTDSSNKSRAIQLLRPSTSPRRYFVPIPWVPPAIRAFGQGKLLLKWQSKCLQVHLSWKVV